MNFIIEIIIVISIVLCFIYTSIIASYCFGWIKTKAEIKINPNHNIYVTIIIAARNEEENIKYVLTAIANQTYPKSMYEVFVIDDCSTDNTNEVIKEMLPALFKDSCLLTILPEGNEFGKKYGITNAINKANGELIITVDADCIMFANWLSTIVAFYKSTNAKMIVAPVCFFYEKTIFEKMQTIEFNALMASSCGSLYFNRAIMCNGANLTYTKKVFEEINGFEGIDNTATGDDVLLMYKIKNKYPDGIKFLKHSDAIVSTFPKSTIKEFVNQRKRWASKRYADLNAETKFVSLLVYFFNLFLLIIPFVACFKNTIAFYPYSVLNVWILLFAIKCVIDFLLLFLAAFFFKNKKLLIYFLPEQIIYIFYVVSVGFMGLRRKYEWKGRTINE